MFEARVIGGRSQIGSKIAPNRELPKRPLYQHLSLAGLYAIQIQVSGTNQAAM